MGARITFARGLLRLGEFIQSLPVVIMRPNDLVEFSRQSYAKLGNVESWAEDEIVDSGLKPEELDLLAAVDPPKGDLLLLGVGGGREAVPLARMGFRVTGVDYVPAMVDKAKEKAHERGVAMEGLVQDISRLDVPADSYDVVFLSSAMYSCVPTRARRVEMVRRIAQSLRPGGFFLCQFHLDPHARISRRGRLARRLVAVCALGNLAYEDGDTLWLNVEFVHSFVSGDKVRSEIEEGGLSVVRIQSDINPTRGGVVSKKPVETPGTPDP